MIESYENLGDLKYEIELLFKKSNIGRDADISLHVSGEFESKIVSSKEGSRVSTRTNVSSSRKSLAKRLDLLKKRFPKDDQLREQSSEIRKTNLFSFSHCYHQQKIR